MSEPSPRPEPPADPAPTPTRGTRRRARTRQKLTEAASILIAEKGVAGLRIQEITERADVALGSFYNHFDSKEELVEAVVTDTIDVRARGIVARMASLRDPAEAVSYACRRVVRIAYEDPELARLFVNLDRADVLFETIVLQAALTIFDQGLAEGRFGIDDTHFALTVTVGGALAVVRGILDGRYGPDADTLFAETTLRSLGLTRTEAHELATRELPPASPIDREPLAAA
jgi:AcrR family transcriptional regulator